MSDEVVRFNSRLYGLKQASRSWDGHLITRMRSVKAMRVNVYRAQRSCLGYCPLCWTTLGAIRVKQKQKNT